MPPIGTSDHGHHDVLVRDGGDTGVYDASAAPSAPNTTGVRYFGTNENNTLFEDRDSTPGGGHVQRDVARGHQRHRDLK